MTNTRVNEIDLLRFLAALSVVIFHYAFRGHAADDMTILSYPWLASASRYGYLGVELFFMISGFVILMTAANGSLRGFVISRMVRLYPAFWACCTLSFIVMVMFGGPRYAATLEQYLINMTMLAEFVRVAPIDGVYWSLYVELRFYALVAAVLLIGKIHRAERLMILWLAATVLLEAFPNKILNYFLITEYAAFFIAGATCYLIWKQGASPIRLAMLTVSWLLALFESIKGLSAFERHYHTVMSRPGVAAIVTIFFIVMLLVALRRTGWLGRVRWLWAGALTYPLYLLHENIGFIIFNAAYPALNIHFVFWGTLLVILAVSYAVFLVVEKPLAPPMKAALNGLADRLGWTPRVSPGRHIGNG